MRTSSFQAGQPSYTPAAQPPVAAAICFDEVTLRHLRTPTEIACVLPLREEIDLSAHAAAGDAFRSLEKKETSWVSSAPSSLTDC